MTATSALEELRSKLRGYKPTEEVRLAYLNEPDAMNKLIIFIINRVLEDFEKRGGLTDGKQVN